MVQLNFNAANVAPAQGFQVYPSGTYDVMVSNSELKETKAKLAGTAQKGSYIQFNLRIVAGEYTGGTLIARVNYENDNTTAEEIGQAELSAICRVCSVMHLADSQQLHGIPFKVAVSKVERNDKPGEYGNEIKSYYDVNGLGPEQAGQGAPAAATTAPPPAQETPPQQVTVQTATPQPEQVQTQAPTTAAPWQQEQAPATVQEVQPTTTVPTPPPEQQPTTAAPAAASKPPWAQ